MHTMAEKQPSAMSSVLEELNEGRKFEGHPLTGESADLTGKLPTEPREEEPMGGHPAMEEPETGEEEEPSRVYASYEEAERGATETEQAVSRLSQELAEVQALAHQTLQGAEYAETPGREEPPVESADDFMTRRRKEALDEIEELD